MNTKEVLRDAVRGCDRTEAADATGMAPGTFRNMLNGQIPYTPKGNTQDILERLNNLVDVEMQTKNTSVILRSLAEEHGFFLVVNPAAGGNDSPAITAIAGTLKEFGEFIDAVGESYADDGKVDRDEAVRIRKEWEDVKREGETHVTLLEIAAQETPEEAS